VKPRILLCTLLLGLSACATDIARRPAASAVDYLSYAGPEIDDFHFFRLDGWEVVSRNQLIVWTGLQEAYLLKVWEPCTELEYALAIGLTSRFNRVTRSDKVRAGRDLCPIGEIRRLDAARLKADRRKQAAQPAPKPGG
jgi:hypothetical protein